MQDKRIVVRIKLSAAEKKYVALIKRLDRRIAAARRRGAGSDQLRALGWERTKLMGKKIDATMRRSQRSFERRYKVIYE